jgi:hypothetical protein
MGYHIRGNILWALHLGETTKVIGGDNLGLPLRAPYEKYGV